MKIYHAVLLSLFVALAGCSGMLPAPADHIATLPVVTYPDMPAGTGDYVYKMPANNAVDIRVRVDGSALAGLVDQKVSGHLAHDLYLYKKWASEDGQHWEAADKLIGAQLKIRLPSYEKPGPGDIHLTVERKGTP